jgi:hypothetical protein
MRQLEIRLARNNTTRIVEAGASVPALPANFAGTEKEFERLGLVPSIALGGQHVRLALFRPGADGRWFAVAIETMDCLELFWSAEPAAAMAFVREYAPVVCAGELSAIANLVDDIAQGIEARNEGCRNRAHRFRAASERRKTQPTAA